MNRLARRLALAFVLSCAAASAQADSTVQGLPFSQDWSNPALITVSDDWSSVPGIVGYRGDGITSNTGADPQTLLGEGTITVDVNAQATATSTTGGVLEIEAAGTIALAGSGTADAPSLLINLDTTGQSGINVAYVLRDLDASADDAQQQFALQYRIGETGDFSNVPAGYVSDATTASAATLVTPVSAQLPAAADNQPLVQVRIITSNAAGNDELVGVDDISITAGDGGGQPTLSIGDAGASEGGADSSNEFLFTLSLNAPAEAGGVVVTYATADGTATAGSDYTAEADTVFIAEGETSVTIGVVVLGDDVTEDNETFFVDITGATGAAIARARATGTIANDDIATVAIHAIQGTTDTSPLVGQQVATRGIVTGRRSNGFFVQTPDAEADADPATSEGVFVFTGSAPPTAAQIGNAVIVQGTVIEFLPSADPGQLNLTEIGSPTVTFVSAGNALPTPVVLTPDFPSPSGPLDQLERVEGMRVTAASFTVVAATAGNVSEANATGSSNGQLNLVVTGTPRPFREPGIQAPDPAPGGGSIPPIPRWDFNPELLFSDTDALGGQRYELAVGATLSNYVGPLDYGFRRYSVHQDPTVAPTITQGPAPLAARAPTSDEFTFASYNLERFFDTVNDPAVDEAVLTPAAFATRLHKASLGIRDFLHAPDIVGVVEMENLATLQALAAKINADAIAAGQPDPGYVAYLEEGNDVGGIDVGFLVKTGEVRPGVARVQVDQVVQLGKDVTWTEPSGAVSLLNDRPPLQLDAVIHYADGRAVPLTAVVVHQRSLNGAEDDTTGGERVRAKRQRQADYLAAQLQAMQAADPDRNIAVAGDFNAFEFNDGLTDAMGTVTGLPSVDEATAVAGDGIDLVDPDLLNLYVLEPEDQRYSFEFDGNAQSLDHILINQALGAAVGAYALDHARINADFPETNRSNPDSASRLADHDPAIAYFSIASADLAVTIDASPASVEAGQAMTWNATVVNQGGSEAAYPGVGFAFDAELPDLSVQAPSGWSCDAPVVGSGTTIVACATQILAVGSNADFVLIASAPTDKLGQTITTAASVTAESYDPVTDNNSASAFIDVVAVIDMSVAISGPPKKLHYGSVERFTVTIHNAGPDAAPYPVAYLSGDAPPDNAAITAPAGWECIVSNVTNGFGFVCFSTTPMAAQTSAGLDMDIRIPARPNGTTRLNLLAEVDANGRDLKISNNTATYSNRIVGVP
jgi:predicted extracellular nuclease